MQSSDVVQMESTLRTGKLHGGTAQIQNHEGEASASGVEITVDVLPPTEVAARCSLPKRFGVLSIDAEGVGDVVLHAWLDEVRADDAWCFKCPTLLETSLTRFFLQLGFGG